MSHFLKKSAEEEITGIPELPAEEKEKTDFIHLWRYSK
jgi:hypothetical protein